MSHRSSLQDPYFNRYQEAFVALTRLLPEGPWPLASVDSAGQRPRQKTFSPGQELSAFNWMLDEHIQQRSVLLPLPETILFREEGSNE